MTSGGGGPTYCSEAASVASTCGATGGGCWGPFGMRGPMPFGRPKITSEFAVICSPGEMGMAALRSGLLGLVDGGRAMAASTL